MYKNKLKRTIKSNNLSLTSLSCITNHTLALKKHRKLFLLRMKLTREKSNGNVMHLKCS